MSYIKKNATLFIFFLLVLSILSLSGSTIYFQKTMTVLNDNIKEKQHDINKLTSKVSILEINVERMEDEINLQRRIEANLTEQVTGVKILSRTLENEKTVLEEAFFETKTLYDDLLIEFGKLNTTYSNSSENYAGLQKNYTRLYSDVEDICAAAVSLNITDCEDY